MENYEQKYKEALSWAHSAIKAGADGMLKEDLERVFPELKESEDEKIRKELIRAFTVTANKRCHEIYGNGITYGQVLAWLEKQGEQILANSEKNCKDEQNPAWSDEDESWFKEIELMALSFSEDDSYRKKFFDWLNSIKNRVQPQPKQEWSKEELSEFEKEVQNILNEPHFQDVQDVKQFSKSLLDLARKELEANYYTKVLDDRMVFKSELHEQNLQAAYDIGKQDALKALPKWKKAEETRCLPDGVVKIDEDGKIIGMDVVWEGEYFITLQSLKSLPKEE